MAAPAAIVRSPTERLQFLDARGQKLESKQYLERREGRERRGGGIHQGAAERHVSRTRLRLRRKRRALPRAVDTAQNGAAKRQDSDNERDDL